MDDDAVLEEIAGNDVSISTRCARVRAAYHFFTSLVYSCIAASTAVCACVFRLFFAPHRVASRRGRGTRPPTPRRAPD